MPRGIDEVGLFVAQGFDGIEAGGFDGGVHTENEANAHGDAHGEDNGPERDGRRQSGHCQIDQQAYASAEQHANDTSRAGEHHGFGEELPDNVAAARADSFSNADLARALSDGHQHNVHHTDATHEKSNGTYSEYEARHRRSELTKFIGDLLGAGNAKVIGLAVGHVSAAAQHTADLVFCFRHAARVSDGANHVFVVLRYMLVIGAVRDHHCFVRGLILDELALARLKNADNFVRNTADLYGFPERLHIRVKGLGDIGADDGDVGAMHVFRVAEEPPDFRPGIENFFVGRKRPVVVDSRNFLAEITGRDRPGARTFICPSWIETGGDRAHRGTQLSDGLGVFQGERFARSFVRTEPAGVDTGIEAEDEEGFRTIVRQIGVHITVDADENGDHGKNGGNADDHAENGEKGAHLILAQSGQRHLSVLADVHAHGNMHGSQTSWRKASIGCRAAARRAG